MHNEQWAWDYSCSFAWWKVKSLFNDYYLCTMSSELGNIPVPLPCIKWNPEKSKDLNAIFLCRQTSLGHNVIFIFILRGLWLLWFELLNCQKYENFHCSYRIDAIDHGMSLSLYLSFGWWDYVSSALCLTFLRVKCLLHNSLRAFSKWPQNHLFYFQI